MGKVRWVAALALLPDDIQSIEPNVVTATLKNGEKVKVAVYMVDDEHVKGFSTIRALEAYNKANKIEPEEEYHGAD
jgi:ribosomal protein S1